MAIKTIHNIGIAADNTITIPSYSIVSEIGADKKVLCAMLKLNNAHILACSVKATCGCEEEKTIDQLQKSIDKLVCINITHEIDCMIKNSKTEVKLTFSVSEVTYSTADIDIEYIPQQIMFQNNSYVDVNANNAGGGSVNVATGQLRFQTNGLVYNGWQANKTKTVVSEDNYSKTEFPTFMGKGWKLGIQQYLVKGQNGNVSEYTYVDGNGNYHKFSEKYYYVEDGKKCYVAKSKLSVDLNGELVYGNRKIKIERRSTDNLILETDYASFKQGYLIEQRQDEQIQLEENVSALYNQLSQYVEVSMVDGAINNTLKDTPNKIKDANEFLSNTNTTSIILTESEAIQYKSLLLQQTLAHSGVGIEKTFSSSAIVGTSKIEESTNNTFSSVSALPAGKYQMLILKNKLKELQKVLVSLTKKNNYAASSNDKPNYQYEEYINYLKRHLYKHFNRCCINGINSLVHTDQQLTDINQTASDEVDSLLIPYQHLKNGYCDLQAELDRISDDLAEAARSGDSKNNAARQKVLEQRLRVFQNEFNNKIDHIQTQINTLDQIINNWLEEEQGKLIDRQISMLINRSEINKEDLKKYYKQYVNAKDQLDTIYRQMPVSFITSGETVLGFNKFGQFIATFDGYGNQTSIIYKDDKIVSVKDTDNNETTFEYTSNGLLQKIVDASEKITQFFYTDGLLTRIVAPNGEEYTYSYCDGHILQDNSSCANHELQTATDNFGRQVEFVYDEFCRVKEIRNASDIYSVSDNQVLHNDTATTFDVVTLTYNSNTSTSVTNENGVVTTYIFDNLGKPVTVYEGSYYEPGETTKAISLEYTDNKQSYAIEENRSAQNLLNGITPTNTLADAETRQLLYVLTPSELPTDKTDFVLSAWAKADSAYVVNARKADPFSETLENDCIPNFDLNQRRRKFELAAEVYYNNGDIEKFTATYDWLNTDWQYLTLPIELHAYKQIEGDTLPGSFPFILSSTPRTCTQIAVFVDYSYNVGEIQTDCMALREGDWTYSTFDENGRKITEQDSKTGNKTFYTYDDDDRVVESTIVDHLNRKFTSTFEYNKQGKLVRSTNYAGLVEETIYDEKGNETKKITYNLDDPTSKLYTESKRDDKGNITADIDESGQYDSTTYTYNHTGQATVQTDGKGNRTAFGYKDGNLVSISGSTNGEESTNTMHHTAGLLTTASNGATDYGYVYDGQDRVTSVRLANANYSTTEYPTKNKAETTLANGDKYSQETDKYGNVTKQVARFANGKTEQIISNFDENNRISQTVIDNSLGERYNISYSYDARGNVTSQIKGGKYALGKTNAYTADNQLQSTTYTVSQQQLAYVYETDQTPDKRNAKVTLPFNVQQAFSYDGIGRTRSISLGENLSKDIYYAKYGDHATNRINSIWFGVNGIRKDNTKYTYDKAGNIATVTENGKLVARYFYDGLNRLVRQDDINFGTVTYKYDHAGNITCKTTYALTFDESLGTPVETQEYTYRQRGWQDQLVNLNGQSFEYDAIGNPTLYCGKAMTWQGRRLLSYNGSTFTYDVDGMRTTKAANNVTIAYCYDDSNLVAERRTTGNTSSWLYYLYGVDGIAGFRYNNTTYLFRKNIQGDVTHIYTESGTLVGQYAYDAWGNCEILQDANGIATLNPFRYRGYYFDQENDLYYLQSRYYDPETCRFVNADDIGYLDPETLNGLNLYAYCLNNPFMYVDPTGHAPWWSWLISGLQVLAGIALCFVPGTQGIGVSLIVGGGLGLISNAVSPVIGQAIGGASSIANGWGAFSTGMSILGLGIPGLIGGIALMLVGGATMAFGANEIVAAATGTNYIQQWTGMSDTAYGWTYFGLNLASSIGQVTGTRFRQIKTRTTIYNKDGSVKQYRYYKKNGDKLYDVDFNHAAYGNKNVKFPHYHGWIKNRIRAKQHQNYVQLIIWLLFGGK